MALRGKGGRGGGFRGSYDRRSAPSDEASAGTMVRHVEVDGDLMGLVVGKEARNLRAIGERTNTRVYTKRGQRNRICIEGDSRESIDEAEVEITRSATNARKKVRGRSGKDLWSSVGMSLGRGSGERLGVKDAGRCRRHACYRFVTLSQMENDAVVAAAAGDDDDDDDLCAAVLQQTNDALNDFRKRYAQDRASALFSVWFHIGQIHVGQLDSDTDERHRVFSRREAHKFLGNPKTFHHFDGGIENGNIARLKRFLEQNAKHVQSYVRHDVMFASPTAKKITFKVWIPAEGVRNEKAGTELCGRYTGSESVVGTKVVPAGPGLVCAGMPDNFRGDVAFPDLPYDCRLLVKAGSTCSSDADESEFESLIEQFCDRVELDGSDTLHMPLPPDGFKVTYERRSIRDCYTHRGFVVTLSDEKEVDKAHQDDTREKIDVKVSSEVCDALISNGRWTSEQLLPELREGLAFIRELSGYIS